MNNFDVKDFEARWAEHIKDPIPYFHFRVDPNLLEPLAWCQSPEVKFSTECSLGLPDPPTPTCHTVVHPLPSTFFPRIENVESKVHFQWEIQMWSRPWKMKCPR